MLARATEAEQPQGDASVASDTTAEIIVTATRQAPSLQDTPMAVDVVTASDVAELSIFDAKEIQNLSPGLQLTNNDGRSNIATLRGVTFDPDSGSSPAVNRVTLSKAEMSVVLSHCASFLSGAQSARKSSNFALQ